MHALEKFLLLLSIGATLTSCTKSTTAVCDDGSYCPELSICVPGGGCADRAAFIACVEVEDSLSCNTAKLPDGICRSGLCVSANCGDGFVDTGESCDDGNAIGGDGCNERCDKIEICGDRIVDVGEDCDDGNGNAVDGCDACQSGEWSVAARIVGSEESVFSRPTDVLVDASGNLYIADSDHYRIRRLDAQSGAITTVAGSGTRGFSGDGGPATSASLDNVKQIAIDGFGNLYIATTGRVRRIDSQTGIIETVAGNGSAGYSGDNGLATGASFRSVDGVAIDGLGNLFIASDVRIRRVDSETGIITTIAGNGTFGTPVDGTPANGSTIGSVDKIILDGADNIFFEDGQHVMRIDRGSGILNILAGGGSDRSAIINDEPATNARLFFIDGLAFDSAGDLYFVSSAAAHRIDLNSGFIYHVAGIGDLTYAGDGGPAVAASLEGATGIAVDSEDNVIVASGNRIRIINAQTGIIDTAAGQAIRTAIGDEGPATSAELGISTGSSMSSKGILYFVASNRVRALDTQSGVITTVVGTGASGFSGDEGLATDAELRSPADVHVDAQDNLFIADTGNHRIRRVDGQSKIITTVAGNDQYGLVVADGTPATEAPLWSPSGVTTDLSGNIFIADTEDQLIRRVDAASGHMSTVAGNEGFGYQGDGVLATETSLSYPTDVAVTSEGHVVFLDSSSRRIRQVDALSGIISTRVGNGFSGSYDDGILATEARIDPSAQFFMDPANNIYLESRRRLRRVDALSGTISTFAGNGSYASLFSGDGGPALDAHLVAYGIAVDSAGHVYISNRDYIRRIDALSGIITTVAGLVSPVGMGASARAKLADPRQIATTSTGLLIAGGEFGVLQSFQGEELAAVAGRYPQTIATANLARFKTSSFGTVAGVAADEAAGLLYLSEQNSHRLHVISMVDPDDVNSWTMEVLAGDGTPGFVDGAIASAKFREPSGLLLDEGTLYVADSGNHVIRALDLASGTITTVAGKPQVRGFSGDDDLATTSLLFSPSALTQCPSGDLYIADTGNQRIRRLDSSSGLISTVLGDGVMASSGEGSPSSNFPVASPLGVTCDASGNVFATSSNTVRMLPADIDGNVTGTGAVHTIYGALPRANFPETITRCLTGIVSVAQGQVQIADSCVGVLVELQYGRN